MNIARILVERRLLLAVLTVLVSAVIGAGITRIRFEGFLSSRSQASSHPQGMRYIVADSHLH